MEPSEYISDPGGGVAKGRIVHYVLGAGDIPMLRELGGNPVEVGKILPAMIVEDWGGAPTVNLKVFTDGPRDYWCTSRQYRENPNALELVAARQPVEYPEGTWHWPPRLP